MKKIHYATGLILACFVTIHLFNHLLSLWGADTHIAWMEEFRPFYRHVLVESLLLGAVLVQMASGVRLLLVRRKQVLSGFARLQLWSGAYLALFFTIHLGAVLGGRLFLHLDTNFYFGVAGLNTFPFNLFFVPYYGLAIMAFFSHIAAIHQQKMRQSLLGFSPTTQAYTILALGALLTILIFYGLTGHFQGVVIPQEYQILVGK